MTKEQILALESRRFKAMCAGDADALDELLHDDITYTHSSGRVDSKASYTQGIRDKHWIYQTIESSDASVSVYGGTALIHCRLRIDLKLDGVPKTMELVATTVWADDGGWKCIAVHSTPAPK
jgi:ketosteroid isomerase-like protein